VNSDIWFLDPDQLLLGIWALAAIVAAFILAAFILALVTRMWRW
jgi:hypothetical protein